LLAAASPLPLLSLCPGTVSLRGKCLVPCQTAASPIDFQSADPALVKERSRSTLRQQKARTERERRRHRSFSCPDGNGSAQRQLFRASSLLPRYMLHACAVPCLDAMLASCNVSSPLHRATIRAFMHAWNRASKRGARRAWHCPLPRARHALLCYNNDATAITIFLINPVFLMAWPQVDVAAVWAAADALRAYSILLLLAS